MVVPILSTNDDSGFNYLLFTSRSDDDSEIMIVPSGIESDASDLVRGVPKEDQIA